VAFAPAALVAVATAILFPRAYPDRPPLGHTGGFGEPTCARCHTGAALNDPGGRLSVEGLPREYRPQATYRLTVTLQRPGMGRAGFQLSVRHGSGDLIGRDAGALKAVGDRVGLGDSLGVHYAFHTGAGTRSSLRDRATWQVDWKAPAGGAGLVVAHVAANAANDDASELGDFVYADSAVSTNAMSDAPASPSPRGTVPPAP
jgi:hypothetical protein